MNDERSVLEDLYRNIQQIAEWIRFADAKAGAIVAVNGVMIAFYAGRLGGNPRPSAIAVVSTSAALVVAAFSALLAVVTVSPRARRLGANSAIHYGTIAAHASAEAFHQTVMTVYADAKQLDRALSTELWMLARIADRKYIYVVWAIRVWIAAFLLGVVTLLL
ncbi:Pycsar system effector family protein [Nonomuraea sp. NPDC050394]|uniref:Pycsar system effector family protein n=1 Tax=Nonomuraea sp. NPDC050394 TaxID=3364363 RepID=UPI0037921C8F